MNAARVTKPPKKVDLTPAVPPWPVYRFTVDEYHKMGETGVLNEVNRKFADPYRFLYDVSKGLWAHYTNFGGNVV